MKSLLNAVGIVLTCQIAFSGAAPAQESSPNVLPLVQNGAAPAATRISNPPTSGWHWPKLWPSTTTAKPRPNQPGTWQKMTAGTKSFFAKTADALNPWDDDEPQPPQKLTGSGSMFTQSTSKKKEKDSQSGSYLPSWPWGTKEQEKPRTVSDFLSQPRPEY